MKKIVLKSLLLTLVATPALAHPGHDHSQWASDSIHLLTAAAITSLIGLTLYVVKKTKNKTKLNQVKELSTDK